MVYIWHTTVCLLSALKQITHLETATAAETGYCGFLGFWLPTNNVCEDVSSVQGGEMASWPKKWSINTYLSSRVYQFLVLTQMRCRIYKWYDLNKYFNLYHFDANKMLNVCASTHLHVVNFYVLRLNISYTLLKMITAVFMNVCVEHCS